MNQGHRISVFVNEIGRTNQDSGIYVVKPTVQYRILRKVTRLVRKRSRDVFDWGQAIAATVNEVHKIDPIDVLEMEESFGWCADVQTRVPIPVVVKLHGPVFLSWVEEDRETERAKAIVELEGKALRQMPAIISPSRDTFLNTVSRYDLNPQIRGIIPNPMAVEVDLKLWDVDGCQRKTILFVGRFDKRKGGDTVLIAFRRLLEMDENLKLIFVGPDFGVTSEGGSRIFFDEFRNSLFTEAQRRSISYLGRRPRAEIADLRGQAMLTIVASRWENQASTVLEAMIQGCPIVASDTGGTSEIIADEVTGLLARPDDNDDLCRKIMHLVNDPARARQLGENARRFVVERHSVQKLATETVNAYRQAISLAKKRKK